MKLVMDIDSERICRIVYWDAVDKVYIITPVDGHSGKWNDMAYDGVKKEAIRELTFEELYGFVVKLLEDRS